MEVSVDGYHWELREMVVVGSRKRGLSHHGSSVKGTLGRASLLRALKVFEKKALGIYGGSVWEPVTSTSTGDFVIWLGRALVVGYLSLWEFCEGNLGGGSPAGDP
jgi:hypothetical protein